MKDKCYFVLKVKTRRCYSALKHSTPKQYSVGTQVCCPRLRATVEEMTRARVNTDNELVNLRINLEEAKNENVTILQVAKLELTSLLIRIYSVDTRIIPVHVFILII